MASKSIAPNDIVVLQYEKPAKNEVTGEIVPTYNRVVFIKNGQIGANGHPLYTPLTNMNKIRKFNSMDKTETYDALDMINNSEGSDPSYYIGRKNGVLFTRAHDGESGMPSEYENLSEFKILFFYPGNNSTRPINLPSINIVSDQVNILARKTMIDMCDGKSVNMDDLQLVQATFMQYDKIYNNFITHEKSMISVEELSGPEQ